ncbi:hypothetical protein N7495_004818 [Penicillium taxi]|uniref:uncharacterized protein n=1 Tax=Penicillium taxi TaxID=168475 RepID=UPI00254519BD|nr:uncharacterized protein N7495_004818 [Penicillium taxi]KAJ5900074.1 hypothetical protein N7495_004818 [Penicillium taxi]
MATVSFGGDNHALQVGANHGSIEFHMPIERPETPPRPLSTVPFPRDPDFVSRDALLDQIREKSSVPASRIALIGLGGAGKSQLAIEYSYQVRSNSPATWVFWVHASNEARFEQSFRDIADQVKISGRQNPKNNIFKLVENWLRDEKIGKWVCILDNVDDEKFLCSIPVAGKREDLTKSSAKPLLEYVPRSQNGSIIITSRVREVALKMVTHKDLIRVQPMERSEALNLLQRKLDNPEESQDCQSQDSQSQENRQLVDALEYMPLAIVQAACFIRNRAPRYSVSQYLRDFRGSDREAIKLLKKEATYLHRDWEAKNSILVTWQMSFDAIRQTRASAAELLSFMSFFDRQGIPEDLIRHQSQADYLSNNSSEGETSDSDTEPDFEDDIMILKNYSFISSSKGNTFFTMHRLVQLTTHAWLKSHGQRDQWRDKFISTLYEEFPTGEYENWERCRELFPHMKSAIFQRPASTIYQQKWATLLYRGAWYTSEIGNITDAREMALKSRDERVRLFNKENKDVLASISMLAIAFRLEGQWEKAEELEEQVLKTRRTNLGTDHPDTLASMANLASIYRNQGRWKEAEQLNMQVLETCRTKLGTDHPDTLTSMANLASTYRNQGRWEEAEQLEVQVLETCRTKLGTDHPDTLISMANLASTYRNQGRWEEAEQLEVQVLETCRTKLGTDHTDTLASMANLASTYRNQGRWDEAEQLEVQVLETRKTKLGTDHPETLTSMANLASTYWNQGRLEKAEQLEVQVLETRRAKLGVDHPDTLTSMANLASTYWNQGRLEKAEQLDVQVLETRKTKLGADHPDTLISMANLAFTWKTSGRIAEAIILLRNCVAKQKQILGSNHPQTLSSSETLLEWEMKTSILNPKQAE